MEWSNDSDNDNSYDTNTEYIMTESGLKRTHPRKDDNEDKDDDERPEATEKPEVKERPEAKERSESKDNTPATKDKGPETGGGGYRYKKNTDSVKPGKNTDTNKVKKITKLETTEKDPSSTYVLSALLS
jgi:hypothetical protein